MPIIFFEVDLCCQMHLTVTKSFMLLKHLK